MKTLTLYALDSRAFVGRLRVLDDAVAADYATAMLGVYDGEFDPDTHYVAAGSPETVAPRTAVTLSVTPAAPVVGDTLTVSGLPNPCWVRTVNGIVQVTGGTASHVAAQAGRQWIELVGAYSGAASVVVSTDVAQALFNDPRWQALLAATPAQIDSWLASNVTNIAQARQVLLVLLLAVRKLGA